MNVIKKNLAGADSAAAIGELSQAFGTEPDKTRVAVAHVIDEFTRRLERNTLSRGGLAELVRAVGDSHHEAYLRDPRLIGSTQMDHDGKAILDHVFWTKDTSRGVAARAARDSGLPAGTIENMMPSIAALTMGELTRAAAGPFDDILRRIPGIDEALRELQKRGNGGGSSGDFGGGSTVPSVNREAPVPRTDYGGGSIPDQQPLPVPGEYMPSPDRGGSRYDDLSDVLRRGGFRIPGGGTELPDNLPGGAGGAAGGTLYNLIRAVLGALLGFKSSGFLSWIIRLIVVRWGWGFIQRILGRILGRVLLGR